MSDPIAGFGGAADEPFIGRVYGSRRFIGQHAARRAVDPIRGLFDRLAQDYATASLEAQHGMDAVLNPLRHRIFTTEELES